MQRSLQPLNVGRIGPGCSQGQKLRDFVRMMAFQELGQGPSLVGRGFYEKQELPRAVDPAFPPVTGIPCGKRGDTRGKAIAKEKIG